MLFRLALRLTRGRKGESLAVVSKDHGTYFRGPNLRTVLHHMCRGELDDTTSSPGHAPWDVGAHVLTPP